MARPRKVEAPPVASGLIASAVRLPKVTAGRVSNGESWQAAAWAYYDACPELRFVANWVGSVMSRAELLTVREEGRDDKTVSRGPAADALTAYFHGQYGQAEMLRQTGIHLTVAGEALALDTPVATPTGFTAMGDLREGDLVLGGDGKPCRVTKAHDVLLNRPVYRVRFTGGAEVIADAEHLWLTHEADDRAYARQYGRPYEPTVLTTEQMRATLRHRGRNNHAIAVTAIEGTEADLPLDPYLLGYWLGDGTTTQAAFAVHHADQPFLRERVEKAGYMWSPRAGDGRGYSVGVTGGFRRDLVRAGVLGDKHIPAAYLRASNDQRLALLQGLIDSDGHVDKQGRVEFANINQELLWQVRELAATLGLRPFHGRNRIGFVSAGVEVAGLPRKAERVRERNERDRWRYVTAVDPVESVPVRCITVDSPDHTFLVTQDMIATHNCYHYYRADQDEWRVIAVGKVRQQGNGARARVTAEWDGEKHDITSSDILIRVWNPHPIDPVLADSPTRANLQVLAEIDACSKHIGATLSSRLAGNGILFVPQDITFPIPQGMDSAASSADVFMQVLGDAMMTPIKDPDSAAAVVPVVVQAPGESLNQIKHMTFWSALDDNVRDMRDAAVKRLALGMDIPPEVLLGLSDTNHWNAWLVDEASVKAHTEPRLAIVTNAITTAYLRPALDGAVKAGAEQEWAVVADTSNLRLRPNRSREAIELYDRGELNADALRRETGFEQEDKPQRNEFMEWLLRKIALGSTSPEQTQAAIEALGVPVHVTPQPNDPAGKERPSGIDNVRSLDEHPTRSIAPIEGEVPPALLAACDVLVYRALERAGNRLKSASNYTGKTSAADLYTEISVGGRVETMMTDAWSCADRVLDGLTEKPSDVALALDVYVRGLLTTQTPHSRERMAGALATLAEVV